MTHLLTTINDRLPRTGPRTMAVLNRSRHLGQRYIRSGHRTAFKKSWAHKFSLQKIIHRIKEEKN